MIISFRKFNKLKHVVNRGTFVAKQRTLEVIPKETCTVSSFYPVTEITVKLIAEIRSEGWNQVMFILYQWSY